MLKNLFIFLIVINLFLILFCGCTSTLPFIKKTIIFTEVPKDYFNLGYLEEME